MGVKVDKRGSRVRVELSGEPTRRAPSSFMESARAGRERAPEVLVLDLRRLRFMDSSGLREIVDAARRGRDEGRHVALVRAHGPIEDLLDMTRVEEMTETVEDPAAVGFPDEAVRA